jgi:WS/DGAT/MGAT family acyltransferase
MQIKQRETEFRQDRLSDADAILWTLDRDPLLRSAITAVIVLDREPPFDEIVERLAALCGQTHRFRSTVAPARLPWERPHWTEQPRFDVTEHMRHVRAASPGSLRTVLDLAQGMALTAFDPARPLWEAAVVDGVTGGKTALIIKVHHAVIDGVGGLQVAASILDLDRAGTPLMDTSGFTTNGHRAGHESNLGTTAVSAISEAVGASRQAASFALRFGAHPVQSTGQLLTVIGDARRLMEPTPRPLSPLWRQRTMARRFEVVDLPPDRLPRAAAQAGVTLNDVFVAGLLHGISLYHRHHDADIEQLRMIMPISTRHPTDPVESNRFVPVRVVMPAGLSAAQEYLFAVPRLLAKWKHSAALGVSDVLASVFDRLPAALTIETFALMLKGVDFVATNVPGPPVQTFVTMAGNLTIGLTIDSGAVPDHAVLSDCLGKGIAEVCDAAALGAPNAEKGR